MTSRSRLRTSVVPFAVLTVLMLPLTGCSGSDDSTEAVASAQAHASELAKNAGSEGVTASEAAADDSASGSVDSKQVCADIEQAVDTAPGKDPISTQAKLVGVLSELFAPGGALAGESGSTLDGVTEKACPDVKAEALKQAGISSFGNL